MTFVSDLEPSALWAHFDRLLEIPRGSRREERAREHVLSIARRNGLEHEVDATGNVVVRKPARPGREDAPAVVLQAHLDMVQEKNSDTEFDFDADAIRPVRDGEWLRADGTTLGSDNGIGVAAMLALLEAEDVAHGPLELLFTIDEETGLTGAAGLDGELLRGRTLINLDSEEEAVLTIGCAGGADTHLHLPVAREAVPDGAEGLEVRVAGLKGGHSGVDVHLQRGNAIAIVARALRHAFEAVPTLRVASLAGGNAHNAIPREAHAVAVVDAADAGEAAALLEAELAAAGAELATSDPGLTWTVERGGAPADAWTSGTTADATALLAALPFGVLRMSDDIEGLVETSTNLAVASEGDGRLTVLMSSRSSVMSALAAVRRRLRALGALVGAEVAEKDGYPGWKPDPSSPLLGVMRTVHREVTGVEPEVGAVHAGLECGIIGEKVPGMDMISFGPQIEFPHSPDERVRIDSVAPFWRVVTATLERLAD
ncbi:MAG: aminoacyl-histidine dipeptidase [Gemmatimonadota bacterium]|nr:aminoacyl-histidine dipeptidase [Gemmatimonadota bacterium]